jgi:hypothetical protein
MSLIRLLVLLLPWIVAPAQSRTASRITVERHEACAGLSTEQCCEQMVAYASFQATGEQLAKRAAQAIGLRCRDKARLASKTSCKNVAFARGLAAKVVERLCETSEVKLQCEASPFCSQCSVELVKLTYSKPQWLCYAATYQQENEWKSQGPIVVHVPDSSSRPTPDGASIVIKKRQLLR